MADLKVAGDVNQSFPHRISLWLYDIYVLIDVEMETEAMETRDVLKIGVSRLNCDTRQQLSEEEDDSENIRLQ